MGLSWRNTIPWSLSCEKYQLTRQRGMKQFGISIESYPEEISDFVDDKLFGSYIIWVFVWSGFLFFTMDVAIATKFQVWYI